MATIRKRLMLAVGAALLVGGWGATRYGEREQRIHGNPSFRHIVYGQPYYVGGVVSMAIGAGLIGFAVLRQHEPKEQE